MTPPQSCLVSQSRIFVQYSMPSTAGVFTVSRRHLPVMTILSNLKYFCRSLSITR